MSETDTVLPASQPITFIQKVMSDLWLSVLATLAIAFSHVITGLYDTGVWIGLAVIYVIVAVGYVLARLITIRILPDLFWVSIVAMLVTWPGVPGSAQVRDAINGVSLLPTLTPLMAFAALGLGSREVQLFKQAGWKFILISVLVFFGTFMGSAIIANIALSLMGA